MVTQRSTRRLAVAGLAAGLLVGAACGDDGTPDPGSAGGATAAGPSTAYTVVTTDNRLNITRMSVPAGQEITVVVRNDGGALHNWRVLDAKDAAGKAIETPLLRGGESATVTFTLDTAGRYSFRCDTHPAEMKGTLAVQ